MRHLIDSQALIWYVDQDHLLSPTAHAAITDPNNDLLIAQITVENVPVIRADAILDQYGINRIW